MHRTSGWETPPRHPLAEASLPPRCISWWRSKTPAKWICQIRFEYVEISASYTLQPHVSRAVIVGPKVDAVVATVVHCEAVTTLVEHNGVAIRGVRLAVASCPVQSSVGVPDFHSGFPRHVIRLGPHDHAVVVEIVVLPCWWPMEGCRHPTIRRITIVRIGDLGVHFEAQRLLVVTDEVGAGVIRQLHIRRLKEAQRVDVDDRRNQLFSRNAVCECHGSERLCTIVSDAYNGILTHRVEA